MCLGSMAIRAAVIRIVLLESVALMVRSSADLRAQDLAPPRVWAVGRIQTVARGTVSGRN